MASTQTSQKLTTMSLPTPTIPAPERVVEIISSNNVPSESITTASQSLPTTITTVNAVSTNTNTEAKPSQTANTKSLGDTDENANLTTDPVLNSSDGVTGGNELTTE